MSVTAQEKGKRQPQTASEKRRPWLERFSLAVAALLLFVFAAGNTQANGNEAVESQAGFWGTLGAQAQAVVTSGTRFVSDVRLLYQIARLRDASIPEAQASMVPQEDVKVCKVERSNLPPAAKGKRIRL